MSILKKPATGAWRTSAHGASPVQTVDYRAGNLITRDEGGCVQYGPPSDFQAADGRDGLALLDELMPPPSVEALHHGAVREALANYAWTSQHGFEDTRSWESESQYIATDGEGNHAVIYFTVERAAVSVGFGHDSGQPALTPEVFGHAPSEIRASLARLSELAMFSFGEKQLYNSVFWSSGGRVRSYRSWPSEYTAGSDIFRRELLGDDAWLEEASEYYEHPDALLEKIVSLSKKAVVGAHVSATRAELDKIVSPSAPHFGDLHSIVGRKFAVGD